MPDRRTGQPSQPLMLFCAICALAAPALWAIDLIFARPRDLGISDLTTPLFAGLTLFSLWNFRRRNRKH